MPVCIAGMHRSGTSMITRLLNINGLYLGENADMMPSAEDNPEGFFENIRFSKINDELLEGLGGGWDYLPNYVSAGWENLLSMVPIRAEAEALINELAHHSPWGWKDPRNSLTLPFWKTVLSDLKFVVCLRNPLAVAGSLNKRGSASLNFSLQLWLLYNKTLLNSLDQGEFIVVNYDHLFFSPNNELVRLLNFLNFPVQQDKIDLACATISPSLQHHHLTPDDIKNVISPYRADVLSVYEELLRLSEIPADQLGFKSSNKKIWGYEVRKENLQDFDEIIRGLKYELELKDIKVRQGNKKIKSLIDKIEQLNEDNASLEKTIAEIHVSSSWRITAPWRFLGRMLNKATPKIFMMLSRAESKLPLPNWIRRWLQKFFIKKYPIRESRTLMHAFFQKRADFNKLNRKDYFRIVNTAFFNGPVMQEPLVTIVIPVYNQLEHTVQCLLSIADLPDKTSYEIIVVDDLSNDDTERVIGDCRGVRYIRNQGNLGFLKSCNAAVSKARGKYILLLNNDTYVFPGWLDALVATFDEFSSAGLVGSKLINPDASLQEAGGIIWRDGTGWNYGRGDSPDKPEYNYLREVDYCSGASIMVPKTIWDEMEGFDEIFAPAYYEDTDLAFRIRKAGYQVLYQPKSQLVHFEGVSSGRDITQGVKSHQESNRIKFVSRWAKTLSAYGYSDDAAGLLSARRYARGRILFIDAVTPTPDQDSGSIDAFNYMKMFRKFGYEVSFLPVTNLKYISPYTSKLQAVGVECQYFPFITSVESYIRKYGQRFELVFVSRFPVAKQYLRFVRETIPNAKLVFNTVDLHFLRESRQAQITGEEKEGAKEMEELELDMIRQSDMTVVVSERELEIVNAKAPDAKVVAIPIPRHIPGRKNDYESRKNIAFLGGYQHQPNVDAVHYFMSEIWPLVSEKLPLVSFIIAGSKMPKNFDRYKGENVILRGFVENLDDFFNECRITIAPLRYGAGVKGKIVTSLSYGVPCVATPMAVEGMGLEDGKDILVSTSPKEFAEHMIKLYKSPDLWLELSEKGLNAVTQKYSLSVVEEQLASMLDGLIVNE